jgi:hypothetical protein
LYANSALYALFALWCSIAARRTADGLGYLQLSRGGHSEYLVVYGGLQLGLAVVFWLLAQDPRYHRLGLLISLAVYAPIVTYRWITCATYWPVGGLTLATACLETVLLLAAVGLFVRAAP